MRESARITAIRTALDPIPSDPVAARVVRDLDRHGDVTPATRSLLHQARGSSPEAAVLLDLVAVLLHRPAGETADAHPARAMGVADRFFRAYVGALAIMAGQADRQPPELADLTVPRPLL